MKPADVKFDPAGFANYESRLVAILQRLPADFRENLCRQVTLSFLSDDSLLQHLALSGDEARLVEDWVWTEKISQPAEGGGH